MSLDHVLPDGTTVRLRPVRADDDTRMLGLWNRSSEQSRRFRFLGPFELHAGNVMRFTHLDGEEQFALAAVIGRDDEEQIIGVARYERLVEDPTAAEFAALVEDAHQGRGVGTALLREVARHAMEQGIERLTGEVLANNSRMMHLVRDLGLDFSTSRESPLGTVVQTDFDLAITDEFLRVVDEDERRAAAAALGRFFHPERVAVVGASRDPASIGGLVFGNLLRGGFEGVVYPVNRGAAYVQGVASYPDLTSCPDLPDLVLVCVPGAAVASVVDEAGRLGVKAVCVISAGFAEVGDEGAERQRELLSIARGHGLRIVGPNCMGLLNGRDDIRMNATFSSVLPRQGRIAFSSQSGALGLAVLEHAEATGLGISTFVSVGNKADISGNDLLLYWENDPDTDVILLYLESFGNPRKFARIARRIGRSKPIAVVKSGRSRAGRRAASSHTGALAAGDTAVEALFRQAGVIRTDTLEELFHVAELLTCDVVPTGRNCAVLTNAGGPGILAVDALEANGLEAPALSDESRAALATVLPAEAGLANPVDMIAGASADDYGACVEVLSRDPAVDVVFVIYIPTGTASREDVAAAVAAARDRVPGGPPVVAVMMNAPAGGRILQDAGIPAFQFPEDAARALGRVATYGRWRSRDTGTVVRPDDIDAEAARAVVDRVLASPGSADRRSPSDGIGSSHARRRTDRPSAARRSGVEEHDRHSVWLENVDAEAILRAYGIPLPRTVIVHAPEEGAVAQDELGCPVAVKVAAPIHKADVGGVRLGLTTPEATARALHEIEQDLHAAGLGEHAGAYVVQEMVHGGVEMVVGVTHDPSFGPIVMTGMGGTLVELLQDVSVRITPLTDRDVDEMLDGLRMRPLLDGYRGDTPKDVDALRDLLHRINAMVEDLPEITELDLNPVFVREQGAVAVDIRMRISSLPDTWDGLTP